MGYQEITYDVADAVATITLNRPEKLNAWTRVMEADVRRAMAARELARMVSPRSMAVVKRQVWEAQFQTRPEATGAADVEMRRSFDTADFREGVAHFLEKRPPSFTGR